MKVAVLLLAVVVAASAGPEKRFDLDSFEPIGQWFTHVWDAAKDEFNHLTSGLHINFDDVVQKLIPLIDSGMTETACTAVCVGAAASVLGPAAPLAGIVCGPACKGALAKLEEAAGR